MTSALAGAGCGGTSRGDSPSRFERSRDPLVTDSPWRDRRLWLVQLAVAAIYIVRLIVEVRITHAHAPVPGIADFTTLGLFLWPVLYAAVTVGPTGGAVTAAWVAALSVPRDLAFLGGSDPVGAWAESTQVAALCVVAVVVGMRVAAERSARDRAERAGQALLAAEARYRALFESSVSPTLLVDRHGTVLEANAAAVALGGGAPTRLADLVGSVRAAACLSDGGPGISTDDGSVLLIDPRQPGSGSRRFQMAATDLSSAGDDLVQVVLSDVTAEAERRAVAESYAEAVVAAQEEERRRLAQDLHDGPLQTLVHVARQVEGADKGVGSQSEVHATVLDLVDELRRIARGLRPSVLDDLGLVAAVQRLLGDVEERSAVTATLGTTGTERRLTAPVELALFRVAQEAVSNAERHAEPTHIAVGISFETSEVRLLVSDDGRGFDPARAEAERRPGALGLSGMRERLLLTGGRLVVHAAPGQGTTVEAVVPALPP